MADNEGAVAPEKPVVSPEVAAGGAKPEVDQGDLEARARRMGWRPKDEFRGDPSRWTDAKSFIDKGETELPILRDRYRALDDRFARTETELKGTRDELKAVKTGLDDATKVLQEFREFSRKSEERAYLRAKAELEQRMFSASEAADVATVRQVKAELDRLEEARPQPEPARAATPAVEKKPDVPPVDPAVQQWIGENEWFNRDTTMRDVAIALHGGLLRDKPGMNLRDNLAEVRREIIARFPEKFGNSKREAPPAVSAPAAPPKKDKKTKSESDMTPEMKAAYQKFKKWMPDYTVDEYLKNYFAGDEA